MSQKTDDSDQKSQYESKFKADYLSDWELHRNYIQDFDAFEAMLIGKVYDSVSQKVDNSKITDSYATTLAKERADRVVAKLPEGQTISVGKADVGKAAFMDILRQKWIYPNCNAQRPFLEKLNLWQLYSSVYGYMPMFYDWGSNSSGYVGPDCWLWNPRNLIPQQGKVSVEDMDYITALTWISRKRLQDIVDNEIDDDGWDRDALQELINQSDKTSGNDTNQDTLVERERVPSGSKKGICLATRYEAGPDGEWCTFAPDNGYVEIRRLKNPHKNGRIPFVIKYSQPLFDSFYGMGDFQRAKPLQFARDGLSNFYFANLKRNLAPGIIANANGVVKHSLDVTKPNPILLETIPNSIRPMPTNTAGLSTYQAAQSSLTGSLLSLFGTQNASIPGSEALNPSQGKTPAAINMFSDKEATRDGSERRHLETAVEQLTDGMFSLVVGIGTESIPVSLFADDIEDIIKAGLGDVVGLFSGGFKADGTRTAGDLVIDPAKLKGVEYRFNIDTNSTAKIEKANQLNEWQQLVGNIGKFQNIFKDDERVDVNWAAIMKAGEALTDIKGANEFITQKDGPTPQEQQLQAELQKVQAQAQSKTQMTSPNGQVHESADLVKMFVAVEDMGVKNAILEMMGLPPMNPVQQPITNSAGVFSNPHVAAAAEHVAGLTTTPPAAPTPTINKVGAFHDPTVAGVAEQVAKA